MRLILRLFLLLLAWGPLGRTVAWAQTCPAAATSTFNYTTTTATGTRMGTGTSGNVGSANTFTDAVGRTSLTYSNYVRLATAGGTNTFSVATNGALNNTQSLVWQQNDVGSTLANNEVRVTLTFTRSVTGLKLVLGDVDRDNFIAATGGLFGNPASGADFQDNLTFNGYTTVDANGVPTGTPIALTAANFTVGATNQYVSGNTAQGISANTAGAVGGNLTVDFGQSTVAVRALTIVYRNTHPIVNGTNDRTQTIGINTISWCRAAPVANDVTNTATLPANAGQVDIDNLSSTLDAGTVNNYTVTAIPPAAQGVLYYNSTGSTYAAVANGQTLTAAQAASLRFDPAAGATGPNTTFSYTVTDNGALTSNTAVFTIPLSTQTPCAATATLDYNTRPAAEDWKAHAAIGVPTGSALTTVGTNGYTVTGNPTAATLQTAGLNANGATTPQTLVWSNDYPASGANNKSTVTFNFSRPVSNYTVRVQDIDGTTGFQDQVTFTGSNGGTVVTPVLSPVNPNAAYFTVSGNTATAVVATGANASYNDASVIAYFGAPITSLTITYANITNTTGDPGVQLIGIDLLNFCRLAPVANPLASTVPQGATQASTAILSSQVDGTVTSYSFTSVPTAAQGTLFIGNTAVTTSTVITAAQASQLTFTPAAGFTGAFNLAYTVKDDANQVSSPATYAITVNPTGASGTPAACANPGKDGSPTGLTTNPNTYYPSTAAQTVAAGATSITVGVATGTGNIAAGDLLLVIQMQGADIDATNTDSYGDGVAGGGANGNLNTNFTAGSYEYVVANSAITATAGGTIQLATALKNGYVNAAATTTAGQRSFQVVRVPQFGNLTLGGNITPTAWNGSVGGVIAIDVAKQTNLNGFTINASGAGFRGGGGRLLSGNNTATSTDYRFFSGATNQVTSAHGSKGEGTAGTPLFVNSGAGGFTNGTGALLNTGSDYPGGSNGRGAPGNAGGGGTDNLASSDNSQNSGGAGGANGGNGGRGGNTWSTNLAIGGEPGAAFAAASSSRLVLGGGGGAGSTNNGTGTPNNGFASSGAAGGGLVMLRTGTVSGTGTILANGLNANNTVANDGSGGGGAGGSILVTATTPAGLANLTLTANGGTGGTNTGGGVPHGPGGGGGGGFILTNGSTAAASAASGAAAGTTNGGTSFGANPGLTGNTNTQISNSVANSVSGASCPADVTTTITGPTTLSVGQPSGTYTATFTNNGTGTASNVTRTVTLPAGATVTAANLPAGATFSTTGTGAAAVTTIDFGTAASLANGASNTFSFSFTAPAAAGSYPLTSNVATDANQGTDTAPNSATLTIQVATPISGTVFEDANYGGGNGRNLGTAGTVGRPGATVELYDAAGNFVTSATTAADGTYTLLGATTAGNYTVRVVNSTVTSARTGAVAGLLPVQTFVRNGTTDNVNRVGGEAPEKQDAAANTGSQTLAALTAGTLTPESITTVSVASTSTPVSTVDFGYNFDVVTNTNDAGQGSLRQFITNSNALGGEGNLAQSGSNGAGALPAGKETSIFMIPSGSAVNGQRAGLTSGLTNGVAVITPATALPTISGPNTYLDGSTQTFNEGNTNNVTLGAGGTVGTGNTALSQVNGPEVQLVGNPAISTGLNVAATGTGTNVIGLSVYGFGNTNNGNVGDNDLTANILSSADNFSLSKSVVGSTATSFTAPSVSNPATNVRIVSGANVVISNNLVGFSGLSGIRVASTGATVTNNEIRSSAQRTTSYDGLQIRGSGLTASGNLFIGNAGQGIDAFNSAGSNVLTGNTFTGNGVGNTTSAPTETAAIRVIGTGNTVSQNVINANYGTGVQVVNGATGVISQNSIYDNGTIASANGTAASGQIGIDLENGTTNAGTAPYVTINDNGDGDTGGNGLLNFPVITSSTIVGTNLVVKGYARPGSAIELFGTGATVDASGFGEGRNYLGTFTEGSGADSNNGTGTYGANGATVNGLNQGTDNTSLFTFTIPLTGNFAGVAAGTVLTSTATLSGGTSEFSGNVAVNSAPVPNDVTNVAILNSSGAVALNPSLSATASGTGNSIASYTVTSLPASGTLSYNGMALTSGNIATTVITNPALLTYQPAASASGTVSFTYTATDNNGIVSTTHNTNGTVSNGPATYTIPVSGADVSTTLAGPALLNAGQLSGNFTATFTNYGPATAASVGQSVTIPAGATNVLVNGVAYTPTNNIIDFGTAATLASGATNSFTYSFTVPTTTGSVTQISTVTTASGQGANNQADTSTLNSTINAVADVATTITPSAASVANGQTASFTVTLANNGPQTANNVVGTVQLPMGLANVAFTGFAAATATYNSATGVVTYPTATYPSGTTNSSTISFTMPANGSVTATASINTTTPEAGLTANDIASATINGTPVFDVATRISGPATTVAGTLTTYSVLTTNNGPSTAANISQTVQLPMNLTNVFVSNGGTYNASSGVVTFPNLTALVNGGVANNTISFMAPAAAFPLSATVAATGDSNTANNTAYLNGSATSTNVAVTAASTTNANLYTTIATSPANVQNVQPGSAVTFTVVAGNNGPNAATGVVERIALPAGLTGVVITGNGATNANYDATTGLVTLPTVTSLASGSANTYTITVNAPAAGMITAAASISATTNDIAMADNVATADVTVSAASDVATAIEGPTKVNAGQPVTYVVNTTNNGVAPAANVVQTVNIPAGLTTVTISGSGTYDPNSGIVTFPAIAGLASGSSVQNTITYNAPAVGLTSIIASVTSNSPDNVRANNSATVTTTTDAIADVTVSISGPTTIVQGNQIDYLVVTTNNGPSSASSVVTRAQLPAGLTSNGGTVTLSAGGSYNNVTGAVTFSNLGTQRSGQEGTVTNVIRFIAPANLSQINASASVTTTTEEASTANNTASIVTTETAPTAIQTDLRTVITSTPATLTAGQPATLTVTTTNVGPGAATGVAQRVALEAGLTISSISNGGTYDAVTGIVTFPIIPLASGTATTNTITLVAPGTTPLQIRALVTGNESDPDATNNSSFLNLTVTPVADVATSVSGPTAVATGDAVTYSVLTVNNGPSLAANVAQTATIPTGLPIVVGSTSSATSLLLNGVGPTSIAGTVATYPSGTYDSSNGKVTFTTIASQGIGANGQMMYTIAFTAPSTSFSVAGNVTTTSTEPGTAAATNNNTSTVTAGPINTAPVANAVVNSLQTPQGNTAGALLLSPLSATDATGSVASYTITSIPNATTQGVLSLNGTAVTANTPILATDAANLRFDPVAGFVGNAFFTYTAKDNLGAVSAVAATYTIPVGQDNTAVFAATPVKGSAVPYQNNDVITYVVDPNGAAYDSNGLIYQTTGANAGKPVDAVNPVKNGVASTTTTGAFTSSSTAGVTSLTDLGLTYNTTTGAISVLDRAKLRAGTYTLNMTTTDLFGGVTTQPVTFTIGLAPLPVTLVAFTATAVGNRDAALAWSTASEVNNDHFDVERSFDGTAGSFVKIGQLKGQGNKTSRTDYALTDANVAAKATGPVYYRLQQVDADGTAAYSPVQTVAFTKVTVAAEATLYPNPATTASGTTLDLSMLPAGTYQVNLVDATGRSVATYQLAGGLAHKLDLQYFASGTYVVLVHGTNLHQNLRLVKE